MNSTDFLKKNISVVFVEPESPGNIGFLARAMKNFGISNLILINPCNLEKEAYYQASHARDVVSNCQIYKSIAEFLSENPVDFLVGTTGTPGGSYNLARIPIKPMELGESLNNINGKIALLLGREGNGLSNDELALCDITVSIPTDKNYPIMNISHAAAIIFYEIFKNRHQFNLEGIEEASLVEKEYLIKDMSEIVSKINLPPHKQKTALKSFKNILGRAFVTGREAHTLKGVLRRINNKLK
ncbi:TrmJ/YjtD family RNA methyltransferase [Methanobacterium alcaliphilum]|uniref:TrmJ/YjtD family RNA methyltransferase n=1 Tax=Methanobacterium alcaliphilum TaxID=392018 RepID=UPI00200B35C5|nr:TrmJ/YjtD family RNA methyltransferase [Methanobacterium alcaliphilum]MCK9151238.1 TrmJ/YjtD family RNA methyltransferase [Methanobacterium alcaliphilum]